MTTNEDILNKLDSILSVMKDISEKLKSDDDQLVNITRAAAILGKTEGAIRQMVHRGQLNSVRLNNGRLAFKKSYLVRYYETVASPL